MNARQVGTPAVIVTLCAALFASVALACGDKLVALGGGVGFERVMVSRHPGRIVMLLEPATGLAAANDKFNLAASLSLAGHEVMIARSTDDLRAKRGTMSAPDLILVDAARSQQFQYQPMAGGSGPMIIPVLYSADSGDPQASVERTGCITVAGGRKGSQLLKAVEHALKLRSRGERLPCESDAGSHQA